MYVNLKKLGEINKDIYMVCHWGDWGYSSSWVSCIYSWYVAYDYPFKGVVLVTETELLLVLEILFKK